MLYTITKESKCANAVEVCPAALPGQFVSVSVDLSKLPDDCNEIEIILDAPDKTIGTVTLADYDPDVDEYDDVCLTDPNFVPIDMDSVDIPNLDYGKTIAVKVNAKSQEELKPEKNTQLSSSVAVKEIDETVEYVKELPVLEISSKTIESSVKTTTDDENSDEQSEYAEEYPEDDVEVKYNEYGEPEDGCCYEECEVSDDYDELDAEDDESIDTESSDDAKDATDSTDNSKKKKERKPKIKHARRTGKLVGRIPTPTCTGNVAPTLMATGYGTATYKNFYSVGHFPKLGIFEIWEDDENEQKQSSAISENINDGEVIVNGNKTTIIVSSDVNDGENIKETYTYRHPSRIVQLF